MKTFNAIVNRGLHSALRRTRVMRGGCYVSVHREMEDCPVRCRGGCLPSEMGTIDGFRMTRNVKEQTEQSVDE